MDTVFVDSNVFLRYLTADNADQSAQAKNLFQKAIEGKVNLITGPPVLFEISWTLKVRYKRNAAEILDILEALVSASWLSMADKILQNMPFNRTKIRPGFCRCIYPRKLLKDGRTEYCHIQ